MPKTSIDVATRALRVLGITGISRANAASDHAYAMEAMEAALAELQNTHSIPATWTIETVPDNIFIPFADLVASEVFAGGYGVNPPNRARAIGRIRAALLPDDREDRRDLDEDGTISDDEIEAGKRAQFY